MIVEMKGINKSFGANQVLKNVDFSAHGGEICALLGENGAGKSTLMNILGGVLPADSGSVCLDGNEVVFKSPAESLSAGIAFIHQELNLVNDLTIYENLFIGRELTLKNGLLDVKSMISETQAVFDRLDIKIDPKTMVRNLDASYKQIVEIARALLMKASIIIMDEPTTSLTVSEINRVFDMMRALREHQVGIVFISHKLNEVMQICDRYTILRDGCKVAEGKVSDATVAELARMMVGHELRTKTLQRKKKSSTEVLRLEKLSDGWNFKDISLSVHSGEVVGVTGLLGDGRSELFQAVFGVSNLHHGQIYLEGKPVSIRNTTEAIQEGIAYIPQNRKENGIIKDMTILENSSIVAWPFISKFGFIDRKIQNQLFEEQAKKLRIKFERKSDLVTSLSGGNQQKVVLAKWLNKKPKVLILDNPTQGVDVGAKEDIYDIILNLADEGAAVVVLSSEAQEIIRVCDRALVLYHGELQGEVRGETMNDHEIMRLATGVGMQ